MENSREKTREEVQKEFLKYIKELIDYYEIESGKVSIREKLESLAFSILVAIDGESPLPAFILAPDPHKLDKPYCIDKNKNYFPENLKNNVKCNISGELHDLFCKMKN